MEKLWVKARFRPVEAKIIVVQEFPPLPTRVNAVFGVYLVFCTDFSSEVAPLTDLLKAKSKSGCQHAFISAKALL